MRAGIVLDNWKLSVFRKRLEEAGFDYEDGEEFFDADTTLLIVITDKPVLELKHLLEQCQLECHGKEPS